MQNDKARNTFEKASRRRFVETVPKADQRTDESQCAVTYFSKVAGHTSVEVNRRKGIPGASSTINVVHDAVTFSSGDEKKKVETVALLVLSWSELLAEQFCEREVIGH